MTAKVISFGNFKGGVGKTTASVALGAELGRRGHKVVLLDFDIQGNATVNISRAQSAEAKMPLDVRHLAAVVRSNPSGLSKIIKEVSAEADYVICDTPGNIESDGTQTAFIVADVVVVPLKPKAYDLDSTRQTLAVLRRVAEINPDVLIFLLKTMPERTVLNRSVDAAIQELGADVLDTVIGDYVAFGEMGATGTPLWELGRSARRANENIVAFTDELLARLEAHLVSEAA